MLNAIRWKFDALIANLRHGSQGILTPWTGLRTLGSSRLVGATMIAPFIGSLILYNQTVVDLFRLPIEVWPQAGHRADVLDPSLLRLKLTYFGLVFIGVASFIFTLACPRLIKQHGTIIEYVEAEERLFTRAHADSVTSEIIVEYMNRTRPNEEFEIRDHTFSYPVELKWRFHSLMELIGEEVDADRARDDDEPSQPTEESSPADAVYPDEEPVDPDREAELEQRYLFRHYHGEFHVDKFMEVVTSGITSERYFHRAVVEKARSHIIDVMAVQYEGANWSSPLLRLLIIGFYILGFGVLAIPTFMTFWAVLRTTL